jgi:cbb3-type cytochrome oxidase subunit 3
LSIFFLLVIVIEFRTTGVKVFDYEQEHENQ